MKINTFALIMFCICFVGCKEDSNSNANISSSFTESNAKEQIATLAKKQKEIKEEPKAVLIQNEEDGILEIDLDASYKSDEREELVETQKTDIKSNKEKIDKQKAKKEKAAKAKKEKSRRSAKIKFEEPTYEYGIIMVGDEFTHRFKFTNVGKKDLVISNVKTSCGCTTPTYPFIPIKPGDDAFIDVHFDSSGKLGKQKSTVTITTNGYPSTTKIYLEGFVDAERAKEQ